MRPGWFGRSERGAALVMSMALVLALSMLVAGSQRMVVSQLASSVAERDYDRALLLAEAGVNAYLSRLVYGSGMGSHAPLIPAANVLPWSSPITAAQFASGVRSGAYQLTRYPVGSSTQGYFVGHIVGVGNEITVFSYGWSNGVVRRVRALAASKGVFEWATLFGINPNPSDRCVIIGGSTSVIGPVGGEGVFSKHGAADLYDGPVIWSNGSYTSPCWNSDPPVLASAVGTPPGHKVAGTLASPLYRHYARSLAIPTVDQVANQISGTTLGAEYFRTHNNNQTGLRYLVSSGSSVRELTGPPLIPSGSYSMANALNIQSKTLISSYGMVKGESLYGIRLYPGDYFLEGLIMTNKDQLFFRTYSDAERGAVSPLEIQVAGDPANPNGLPNATDVRLWIGRGSTTQVQFDQGMTMEYGGNSSRFRVYAAIQAECKVRGRGGLSPLPYNFNILAYNRTAAGAPYGFVKVTSGTYLRGAVIAWEVDLDGSVTLDGPGPAGGPGDRIAYMVSEWSELQ